MKKFLFLFLFSTAVVQAQTPSASPTPEESAPDRGVWRAELPGGTFVAALSAITTVSTHEYVVDGTARVTEVSVGLIGSVQARFYYIEPNTPSSPAGVGQSTIDFVEEKLTDAADRAGSDVWKKVVKKYPEATHAHTVEYRLDSKQTVAKLFKSLESAWMRGRGATFKP